MTNGRVPSDADAILDRIFETAGREQRELGADELMRAIGLKRTSIYSTYAHVNQRRVQHNRALAARDGEQRSKTSNSGSARSTETIATLRKDLQAERERSDQYARVIRRLTLENHELKHGDGVVTDARDRFRPPTPAE